MQKFFILLILSFLIAGVEAQTPNRDSITRIAKQDAELFWLNKKDLKTFRKDRHNYTSDFFKPIKAVVSDTALLKDSVYVKAYRRIAFEKTRKRHTIGHYVLWSYAVLALTLGFAYATTPGEH
jgi:hypothetical protein